LLAGKALQKRCPIAICRQMQLAARGEDYVLASRLRDQMGPLTTQLHPMRQYLWGRVQTLHGAGRKQERIDAISALGEPSGGAGLTQRLSMYAERHAGTGARRALCQSGSLLCTHKICCGREGRLLRSNNGLETFGFAAHKAALMSSGVSLHAPFRHSSTHSYQEAMATLGLSPEAGMSPLRVQATRATS